MSQVNNTNYINKVPLAADYAAWVQNADGVMFTATMQQFASLFQSLANLNLAVSVISVNTVLVGQQLIVANSGGALQFTLPASSLNAGRGYRIFNKGAGVLTVLPNGADTIAGAASAVLIQYKSITLYADGLGGWSTFGG